MQTIRGDALKADFPFAPLKASRLEFGLDDLHDLRSLVAVAGAAGGLTPGQVADLTVAASELASNSILYGGGRGLATVWDEDGAVMVEVADGGRIKDPMVGQMRPDPSQEHGRGLYIANQLCDEVSIDSGQSGTRVRLRMETTNS
jgi:anti-sigma regulatory factor (Ser/Thr protein kinase)